MTKRTGILRWVAVALIVVIIAMAITVWAARKPLLQKLAGNYLKAKGVSGRYQIDSLDRDHIQLSNVVIGEIEAPALTVKSMTINLGWIGLSPQPKNIILNHAVLHATATPSGVRFGALDALIPQSPGPLVLPAIDVAVHDTTLLVNTPYGLLKTFINAHGLLNKNYQAQIDIAPATLRQAGLIFKNVRGQMTVHITSQSYSVNTKLKADPTALSGCITGPIFVNSIVNAPQTLKEFQLDANAATPQISCGHDTAKNIAVASVAAYGINHHIAGTLRTTATDIAFSAGGAKSAACIGTYDISIDRNTANKAQCQIHFDNAAAASYLLKPLERLQTSLRGGTFQSLANGSLETLKAAAQHMKFDSHVAVDWQGQKSAIIADHIHILAQNGVNLVTTRATSVVARLPENSIDANGIINLSGPGVPTLTLDLKALHTNASNSTEAKGALGISSLNLGSLTTQPANVTFHYDGDLTLNGQILVSGAVGDVHIEQARVPLSLLLSKAGALSLISKNNCIPIQIRSLRSTEFTLGAIDTHICTHSSQALFSRSTHGDLDGSGESGPLNFDIKLASQPAPLHMTIKSLDFAMSGTQNNPYLKGNFSGMGTTLASYALIISNTTGAWQWSHANGVDLLHMQIDVTDQTVRPRFNQMRLTNIDGRFNKGVLTAQGIIRSNTAIYLGSFALNHKTESAAGHLNLDTTGLEFGTKLQPYELSELMRGVVENVNGKLDAKALITWNGKTITSTAGATIKAMSLATATLGPVSGINGHIDFDDLFKRTTPPGQILHIASLNPGIAMTDGTVRFQLLPDMHMKIEDARWPFADGVMRLEPVILIPGETEHRMTVAIDSIDVAQFLQQMEFKDLNATGHLTGKFPMVFNIKGGRIEHGILKAAPGGGTIQYVGNTGGTATGQAKIAFDALRDFKYDHISLDVDGDLDGEIITAINFSGVNQIPIKPIGRWTTAAKNVPFKFGVNIKAPFRSLLKSATSFTDARQIIREGASPEAVDSSK